MFSYTDLSLYRLTYEEAVEQFKDCDIEVAEMDSRKIISIRNASNCGSFEKSDIILMYLPDLDEPAMVTERIYKRYYGVLAYKRLVKDLMKKNSLMSQEFGRNFYVSPSKEYVDYVSILMELWSEVVRRH